MYLQTIDAPKAECFDCVSRLHSQASRNIAPRVARVEDQVGWSKYWVVADYTGTINTCDKKFPEFPDQALE